MEPHNPSSRPQARDEAEKLAIAGLSYLAGDPERLSRFLALSGLDLGHLRSAAGQPGFLGGVMAFIAGDEKTLLDFAAGVRPRPGSCRRRTSDANPDLSGEFG